MDSFIPSALRRQRNQRHLTLEAVSAATGMSPQHLSEIESGKKDGSVSVMKKIADVLKVTERTVRRDWRKARAFLFSHLGEGELPEQW